MPRPLFLHAQKPADTGSRRVIRLTSPPWRKLGVATASLAMIGGVALATTPASAAEVNLVVNPSFTQKTTGWKVASPATLVPLVRGTGYYARLKNLGTVTRTVALNDTVNTVKSTIKGRTYVVSAYIRTPIAKRSVSVRLMEYLGTSLKGQAKGTWVSSDTAWHYYSKSYKALTSGSTLDLNVLANSTPVGGSIHIDDARLVLQPVTTSTTPPPPPPPPTTTSGSAYVTGWGNPSWSDEFSTAAVDPTKWRKRDGDYLSYDLACIYARNATQASGYLTMTSKREAGCASRAYTTAYLDTIGLKSWTKGRFEMRAKLPVPKNASRGIWPAFWLRPNDGGAGEIDIMEVYGTGANGSGGDGHEFGETHATIWNTYSPGVHLGNNYQTGTDLSAAFHTYTMEWEAGVMRFYFDGILNMTKSTANTAWYASVYDKGRPFNIRLNQQVGGSWAQNPESATRFPASYVVDYIRVYQR